MPAITTSISAQPAAATVAATDRLPLDQEVGAPVAATALVVGLSYRIASIGTGTNWTAAGAGDSPAVGTVFKCVAVGTGTGTAQRLETRYALPGQMWPKPTDSLTLEGLTVTGTSNLTHIHGALAGLVYAHARNTAGTPLAALTPTRITGSQGDTDRVTVVAARADNAALMPASGILSTALNNNEDGHEAVVGVITGVNTAATARQQRCVEQLQCTQKFAVWSSAAADRGRVPQEGEELIRGTQEVESCVEVACEPGGVVKGGADAERLRQAQPSHRGLVAG